MVSWARKSVFPVVAVFVRFLISAIEKNSRAMRSRWFITKRAPLSRGSREKLLRGESLRLIVSHSVDEFRVVSVEVIKKVSAGKLLSSAKSSASLNAVQKQSQWQEPKIPRQRWSMTTSSTHSHAQIKVKASGSARLLRCIYTTDWKRSKNIKKRAVRSMKPTRFVSFGQFAFVCDWKIK